MVNSIEPGIGLAIQNGDCTESCAPCFVDLLCVSRFAPWMDSRGGGCLTCVMATFRNLSFFLKRAGHSLSFLVVLFSAATKFWRPEEVAKFEIALGRPTSSALLPCPGGLMSFSKPHFCQNYSSPIVGTISHRPVFCCCRLFPSLCLSKLVPQAIG